MILPEIPESWTYKNTMPEHTGPKADVARESGETSGKLFGTTRIALSAGECGGSEAQPESAARPLLSPSIRSTAGERRALPGDTDCHSLLPTYGLSFETRVLTRELLWKPLGEVEVGETLWGFDADPVIPFTHGKGLIRRGQNRARRTKLTVVEAVSCVTQPAFVLLTESGRRVLATEQQGFLGYSGGSALRWRSVKSLSRPYNGHQVPGLASWLAPWQQITDFESGWLSGMFDGEGHVSVRQGKTRSLVMSLSQRQGPVLERAKEILVRQGFSLGGFSGGGTNGDVTNLEIRGGLHERLRAMGVYRPIRLMDKLLASDCDFEVWLRPDAIISIEPVGPTELVDIRTSTGTFFAEGFATRCCEMADDASFDPEA
jgi:hypothetical protein